MVNYRFSIWGLIWYFIWYAKFMKTAKQEQGDQHCYFKLNGGLKDIHKQLFCQIYLETYISNFNFFLSLCQK